MSFPCRGALRAGRGAGPCPLSQHPPPALLLLPFTRVGAWESLYSFLTPQAPRGAPGIHPPEPERATAAPFKAREKQSLDEAVLSASEGPPVPRPLISRARRSGRHNVGVVTSARQSPPWASLSGPRAPGSPRKPTCPEEKLQYLEDEGPPPGDLTEEKISGRPGLLRGRNTAR